MMTDVPEPRISYDGRPWRCHVLWPLLLAALFASIGVEMVAVLLFRLIGKNLPTLLAEAVIQSMGLATLLALLSIFPPRWKLPDKLGIRPPRWLDLGIVVLGLCMIYPWQIFTTVIWEVLLRFCKLSCSAHQALIVECSKASPLHFIAMLAVAGMLIPIVEEVFFRRVLYGLLRPVGMVPAMFATALIFSAMHGFLHGFPALFGLGLVLQWQYVQSRNLLTPIATHMIYNLTSLTLVYLIGLN